MFGTASYHCRVRCRNTESVTPNSPHSYELLKPVINLYTVFVNELLMLLNVRVIIEALQRQ